MALLLEDGSRLLLEDGSALLLEDDDGSGPAMGTGSPDPDYTLFGPEGPDPARTAWN